MKLERIIIGLIVVLFFNGCVDQDDFEIPRSQGYFVDIPTGSLITIDALYSLYLQEMGGEGLLVLDDNYTDKYISGYVISSDEMGNYYEELIIQDAPENPTRGIKLLLDANPLFGRYPPGRKVYLSLKGLCVGRNSGVFAIGVEDADVIAPISEGKISKQLLKDSIVSSLVPMLVTPSEFDESKTNLWLRLENMQFNRRLVMGNHHYTYAGEENDEFDGERPLESCEEGVLLLSTSTFSNFKSNSLPTGRGFLDGILSYDYFGEYFVFVVNKEADVQFTDEERCDPDYFSCEGELLKEILIEEDFQGYDSINELFNNGWMEFQRKGMHTHWQLGSYAGNKYLEITGYNTDDEEIETWLVSPSINMEDYNNESIDMLVESSYDNGAELSILYSSDFDGNVENATWLPLDVIVPYGPLNGFGEFEHIGPVSVSCLDGVIYIAFVYKGSDPLHTTRFHVDRFQLKGSD